jgi:hypothetical protein
MLLTLLIVSLGTGAAGAEQTAEPSQDILQAYRNVLLGEQSYVQVNSYDGTVEEAFMQSEISPWYGFVFEIPLHFVAFSVTDLDADGNPEMLLKLSDDFGFELLRYADGVVYGYPFVARAMEAVTADGEIHGSNGAEDFGWYRVSFGADHQMAIAVVCWKYDDPDAGLQYTIGDTEVTEAEFNALSEELWNKESLLWTEYTQENLDLAVSGE